MSVRTKVGEFFEALGRAEAEGVLGPPRGGITGSREAPASPFLDAAEDEPAAGEFHESDFCIPPNGGVTGSRPAPDSPFLNEA